MRIISGKYKGKIIDVYKGFTDRPTTDFAKEALFDILANYFDFENITVCDLFAGTGNISYEFASRGVSKILAIDNKKEYIKFIQNTSEQLFDNQIIAICDDVFSFVKQNNLDYDIIFADPPYGLSNIETLPDQIFNNQTVSDNAIVIIEHSDKTNFANHPYFRRERKYGKVHFSFFSKKEL